MKNALLPFPEDRTLFQHDGAISDKSLTSHGHRRRVQLLIARVERARRQLATETAALEDEITRVGADGPVQRVQSHD